MTCDVIVIGLGGTGGAAAYRLAQRGRRVLGLEKFTPVHARGSSHGGSRITRQACFEDPAYVPLLLRAHEMRNQIERDGGERIFHRVGGIIVGAPESEAITGSGASAEQWGIEHEVLDAGEVRARFPRLHAAPDEIALHEAGAGLVVPEAAVRAHLVRFYFTPREDFRDHPVHIWDRADGTRFYGFPELDGAVKVAFHHGGQICTPETVDRTVHAHEVEAMANATRSPVPVPSDRSSAPRPVRTPTPRTGTSSWPASTASPWRAASRGTASSSCPSSARSWPTSRSTGPRGTRSPCSTLLAWEAENDRQPDLHP